MARRFRSVVWLLRGLTGSTPAVLAWDDGRLTLTAFGAGALARRHLRALERETGRVGLTDRLRHGSPTTLLDVTPDALERVVFPWFYFGGGVHLHVGGVRYRLSFLRPQNTVLDPALRSAQTIVGNVAEGVEVGARWRGILTGRRE